MPKVRYNSTMNPSLRVILREPILWRWVARLAWLAVALLTAIILHALLPHLLRDTYYSWGVQEAQDAVVRVMAFESYVQLLVALKLLSATIFLGVALLIAWRKWSDPAALVVSALLLLMGIFQIGNDLTAVRYPHWLLAATPWMPYLVPPLVMSSLVLIFFLFPNGQFVPRWTGWVAGAVVVIIFSFWSPMVQQWLWRLGMSDSEAPWITMILAMLAALLLALGSQIYRYRRLATPVERQQVKWVLFGLGAVLFVALLQLVADPLWPSSAVQNAVGGVLLTLAMPLIPLTMAFSIFRYRLWEIDLLINRTLVYGVLTALVLGLYALTVGLLNTVLNADSGVNIALLAGVMTAGLTPFLYPPLRRAIDRSRPLAAVVTTPPPLTRTVAGQPATDRFTDGAPTRITGRWLALVRAGWVGFAGLMLVFVIVNLPYRFERLSTVCRDIECYGSRLNPAEAARLPALGLSLAGYAWLQTAGVVMAILVCFGAALLIFWHKSDDWIALLVSVTFLGAIAMGFESGDTVLPGWGGFEFACEFIAYTILVTLLFIFPNGRFVPRWAIPVWAFFIGWVALLPFAFYKVSTLSWLSGLVGDWWTVAIPLFIAVMTLGAGAQIYRYRRVSSASERRQTQWALVGWTGYALWFAGFASYLNFVRPALGQPWPSGPLFYLISDSLHALAFLLIPLSLTLAILRSQLWDIRLVLQRTLVYSAMTAAIAALYVVIVGMLSLFIQVGGNLLLSALATGLIAILFQPLRQRLQQAVNRLMYGQRDDPVTVLAALGKRLEATTTPEMILATLVETICHALKLPHAAIVLKQGDELRVAALYGEPIGSVETIPLLYQRELVGELRTAPRSPGEELSPADHRLIQEIAQHAGAAAHAARLTADLQQSRERLVTAREEERRRLRRDLHDGLGPQLATLSLKVDAARNLLQSDPAASQQLLDDVKVEMQAAIADIRRLVYDLRPPALDQLGLVSALREYTAACTGTHGLHFQVEAPEQLPPLPAAVEVAAYRIALEAITNVLRHAQARHCTVRLQLDDGRETIGNNSPSSFTQWAQGAIVHHLSSLILEINDDGVGLPALPQAGVGFASMRERAAELGGSCFIESAAGNGTQVLAILPLNFMTMR